MQRQSAGCTEQRIESSLYQTFPVQRLAYDAENNTCTVDAPLPVGIATSREYETLWKEHGITFGWPRMSTIMDALMLPVKAITLIGPIIDFALNWSLTRVGPHLPPNTYFIDPFKTGRISQHNIANAQAAIDELQAMQEEVFAGKWRAFSIASQEILTRGQGKEKEGSTPKNAIQVNAFLLDTKPKKLHINMHGLHSSGNSYDIVAPEAARQFQADQWNITRVQIASIKKQKQQVRHVIAAAIQAGYKDIRLDGYSYGAGLVRTVYHELMADQHCRQLLEKEDITLHYTARNGYQSEGMTVFAYFTRFGERKTPDYKKQGDQAPRPNIIMRIGHFLTHHILRIDTLRNRRVNCPIPENSHNYVVNAVLSEEKDGQKTVMRDGVIGYTNRTSGKKYGHTCIDVDFTLQPDSIKDKALDENTCLARACSAEEPKYNGYYTEKRYLNAKRKPFFRHWAPVLEPNLFRNANEKIAADIKLKCNLTEKKARKKIIRLQHKILVTEKWQVNVGRTIHCQRGTMQKHVPTWVKKQLDVIKEAYQEEQRVLQDDKRKTQWRATFFKLAEIGRNAAEANSSTRYDTTQKFYDNTKTSSRLDRFTNS